MGKELVQDLMDKSEALREVAMFHPEHLEVLASAAGYLAGMAFLIESGAFEPKERTSQTDPLTLEDM